MDISDEKNGSKRFIDDDGLATVDARNRSEASSLLQMPSNLHTFEDVLQLVRPLGSWQWLIYACIAWAQFWGSMINLAVVFFQITPDFACDVIPGSDWSLEQIRNISSPLHGASTASQKHFDACHYYSRDYESFNSLNFSDAFALMQAENASVLPTQACHHFTYDRENNMRETIVTQYDLVCGRKYLTEHSQLVYMFGFLVGSFTAGLLSDKFGRRTVFVLGSVFMCIFGVLQGLAPHYYVFLVIRFLLSVANISSTMAAFCLIMETTTARWRTWVGGLFFLPYAFGYSLLSVVAFVTREWQLMHILISVPLVLSFSFYWILPESPRWLLIRGRLDEANKTIRKANQMNGGQLPEQFDLEPVAKQICDEVHQDKAQRASIFTVFAFEKGRFKYPRLVLRAVNVFFNWFVNSMVYYGIALNVSSFAGDVFINNLIAGAVEIPGYAICVPLLNWGRRRSLVTLLLLCALCLFVVPWIPEDSMNGLRVGVAMFGKLLITASFAIVYVITPELYPTVIRNSGLATSSCVARIGSMIAPYISTGILKTNPTLTWVSMVIFGAFSLAAGLLALFLPETKGKIMPENLSDIVDMESQASEFSNSPTP